MLDILAIKFANSNHYKAKNPNRTVTFSLDEYMTLLDIKDIKDARKRLKEALNTLYSISLEWEEKSKGKV
ncbi:RepB family plasmid replication initiator protein, partial [Streptococcus thermophilus]